MSLIINEMTNYPVGAEKKRKFFPPKKPISRNAKCVNENENLFDSSNLKLEDLAKEIDKIPFASPRKSIKSIPGNDNDTKRSKTVSKRDTKSDENTKKLTKNWINFPEQDSSSKLSSLNDVLKLSVSSIVQEKGTSRSTKKDKISIKPSTPVIHGKKSKLRKSDTLTDVDQCDTVINENTNAKNISSTQSVENDNKRNDTEKISETIANVQTENGYSKIEVNEMEKNTEFIVAEPQLSSSTKSKKNFQNTAPRPFSFDLRIKEFLTKKDLLAKTEKTYEVKKWHRSPEILKKKPFTITRTKRYILPEFNLKFRTDERCKKRPKFADIVDEKQKQIQRQKQLQEIMEVKMLRKTLKHKPTPIPKNIMRSMEEVRKMKRDSYSEILSIEQDLIKDSDNFDLCSRRNLDRKNFQNRRHSEETNFERELDLIAQMIHEPKSQLTMYSTTKTTESIPESTNTMITDIDSNQPLDFIPIDNIPEIESVIEIRAKSRDENTSEFQYESVDEPEMKIEIVSEPKEAVDDRAVESMVETVQDENITDEVGDEEIEEHEDEFLESESNTTKILADNETEMDNEKKPEETTVNDSEFSEPTSRISTYRLLLSALGRKYTT